MKKKIIATLLLTALVAPVLQGCFPIVAAGVATGVSVALDRRTLGAQTDDETTEWKAKSQVGEKLGDKAHLNFTSFNGKVLISGEVPSEEAKAEAERIVLGLPHVQHVFNELIVGPTSSFSARSNDSYITSKVKARTLDSSTKFNAAHLKVVTEAGTTFLLGIMTQTEADSAVQIVRTTSGVKKVVTLIEIVSLAKVQELDAKPKNDSEAQKK